MSETSVLRAERVSREFQTGGGTVRACTDVSLEAAAGELIVVTGRSGAGKSTLLGMLGTIDRPKSGRVFIDGDDVARLKGEEIAVLRREKLGIVFQSFGLLPMLSAEENVEIPLRLLRIKPAARASRVAEALALVGLASHSRQRPNELSGGQQQRVAVARALVARPRLIIADEPTGQLDEENATAIIQVFRSLTRETGVAIVAATHDPTFVMESDRNLMLADGRAV